LLTACGEGGIFSNRPKGVLSKKHMVELLIDMDLNEAKLKQLNSTPYGYDTVRNNCRLSYVALFKKHKITLVDYKSSMEYYARHPDDLNDIYNDVISNITEMEAKMFKANQVVRKKTFPLPIKVWSLKDSVKPYFLE
jgi:hypothetical protein